MIVNPHIKAFENFGLGLFVHFGLYSVLAKGEWAKHALSIPDAEYDTLVSSFNPAAGWAKALARAAKEAGCCYMTLTTRHHDGFSLFDTKGLSSFDVMHAKCRRDLVAEFVAACREFDILPMFYHTLLDWHEKSFEKDFPAYLVYLRKSVELLCKNYGKIGGIWFDGKWSKPNDDWQEDGLYGLIRSYQPEAMIINNTGLHARGALGHIELDSVTFERSRPLPINTPDAPKYIASEMCQEFGEHWGYAPMDLNYKSPADILFDLSQCRRYGCNFLLNVGPMPSGALRDLDAAYLNALSVWTKIYDEAIRYPRPCEIKVIDRPDDFVLKSEDAYYLFIHHLPMEADKNVVFENNANYLCKLELSDSIKEIHWIDNGEALKFTQENNRVSIMLSPFAYGTHLVVRVARISAAKLL